MRKRRISAILAMAVASSMVLAGCGGSDFTLASETVPLELGEELSNNAADYVVFGDNVSAEKQEEILADTTVDLSGVDQDAIGEYEALVIYDGKNLSFTVQVQDTAAPAASLVNDIAEAHTGVEVAVADLVTDIVDAQDVTVQFVTSSAAPAEFEIPDAEVAEDAEAAEGEETAEGAEDAEAVEAEVPDESAQADGEDAEAENTDAADATSATDGADVADGESTDAAPVEGEASTSETVIGEEFADTYTFQAAGQYEIMIRLTDASGNSADLVQKVNVTDPDATAPVIDGVEDITVYRNSEPDYLDGVTATDDVDGDLTSAIVVDSSAVDVSTVGTYTATYSVKDAAGNETIETITISVVRKPQAPAAAATTPTAGTTPASTDNGSSGGSSSGGSSSGGSSSGNTSSGGSSGGSSTPAPSTPAPTTPSTDGNNSGTVSSGDSGSTDTGSDSGASDPGSIFDQFVQDNGGGNSEDNIHYGGADNTGDETWGNN